jgi:tetratricopeptide (TPR) repeat protein
VTAVSRHGVDVDERARLEAERDFLLVSLRDLELERAAGDIDELDYVGLRDDYTARAAAVLRAIDRQIDEHAVDQHAVDQHAVDQQGAAPTVTVEATPTRRDPRLVAIVTAGVLAIAVLAGVLVARSAGERVAGRPLTSAVLPTAPVDDLTRARQLFSERNYLDALKLYDKVLKREPANVEALTYRGWLLFQASPTEFTDRALQSLDQAVAADTRFPDAHFFRGWVLRHGKHDSAAAVVEYRTFLATNPPPEFRQRVEQELNLALCDVGQAPTGITCPPASSSP